MNKEEETLSWRSGKERDLIDGRDYDAITKHPDLEMPFVIRHVNCTSLDSAWLGDIGLSINIHNVMAIF